MILQKNFASKETAKKKMLIKFGESNNCIIVLLLDIEHRRKCEQLHADTHKQQKIGPISAYMYHIIHFLHAFAIILDILHYTLIFPFLSFFFLFFSRFVFLEISLFIPDYRIIGK